MKLTFRCQTLGLGNQSQFEVIPTKEMITQELFQSSSITPSSLNSMGFSQQKLEVLEIEDKGELDSDANLVQALKNQYQALGQHKKERRLVDFWMIFMTQVVLTMDICKVLCWSMTHELYLQHCQASVG